MKNIIRFVQFKNFSRYNFYKRILFLNKRETVNLIRGQIIKQGAIFN